MKRIYLLSAALLLLAALLCGCERGAGTTHTDPPRVTSNVTSSPAPATPTPTPTPEATSAPEVTEAPDATPVIPDATEAPETEAPTGDDTGTANGADEVPQPRRGGLM